MKLADFGLARASGIPVKNYTNEVVTLWYRPPDVLLGNQSYNSKIDIWSIGCIMAEMVNNKPLFTGKNEEDQMRKIFLKMGTPDEDVWPELNDYADFKKMSFDDTDQVSLSEMVPRLDEAGIDLLEKQLQCNPKNRIDAQTAMAHEWFDDVREDLEDGLYSN